MGRAEILQAAVELFARNGFERTSLSEIGAAAGVSRGLPAYFYRNKADLYAAAMRHAVEQVRAAVIDHAKQELQNFEARRFLARLVDAYLNFLEAHPSEVRLLQWDLLQPVRGRRQAALRELFEESIDLVHASLKKAGRPRRDAWNIISSVIGMCLFPFLMAGVQPLERDTLRSYKAHVSHLAAAALESER